MCVLQYCASKVCTLCTADKCTSNDTLGTDVWATEADCQKSCKADDQSAPLPTVSPPPPPPSRKPHLAYTHTHTRPRTFRLSGGTCQVAIVVICMTGFAVVVSGFMVFRKQCGAPTNKGPQSDLEDPLAQW